MRSPIPLGGPALTARALKWGCSERDKRAFCCVQPDLPFQTSRSTRMASNVTERDAREVAEAARETEWTLPSFGKELFLGNFRLDLIHPQPKLDPAAVENGEAFIARLRTFLEADVDPLEIEREAKIPDHVVDGLKKIGALGIKVSAEYSGLGLSQVYYNKALMMAGAYHASLATLLSAPQSIGLAEP